MQSQHHQPLLLAKLEQTPTQQSCHKLGRFEITEQDATQQLPADMFSPTTNPSSYTPPQHNFYLPAYPTLYVGENTGALTLSISALPPHCATLKLCGQGLLFKPSTITFKCDSTTRDAEFTVSHISQSPVIQPCAVTINYAVSGVDAAQYNIPAPDTVIILPANYTGVLCQRCVTQTCTQHANDIGAQLHSQQPSPATAQAHKSPAKHQSNKLSDPLSRKYSGIEHSHRKSSNIETVHGNALQSPTASPVVTRQSGRFLITEDQQLVNANSVTAVDDHAHVPSSYSSEASSVDSLYDAATQTNTHTGPHRFEHSLHNSLPVKPSHTLLTSTTIPPNATTTAAASPLDLLSQLYTQVNQLIHENTLLKQRNQQLTTENTALKHQQQLPVLQTDVPPSVTRAMSDNVRKVDSASKRQTRWNSPYQTSPHVITVPQSAHGNEQESKQQSPMLTALPMIDSVNQSTRLISVDFLTNTQSPSLTGYKTSSMILDPSTLSLNTPNKHANSNSDGGNDDKLARSARYATLQPPRNGNGQKQSLTHMLNQLRGAPADVAQQSDLLSNI